MASSIVRRSVWEEMPFDERIQYSEDVEWTCRARKAGYKIAYAPLSRVYHSHNYTWREYYRRQFGEGKAEARIFEWEGASKSWVRYSVLPYVKQVLLDTGYCLTHKAPARVFSPPYVRLAQLMGRRKGFREGMAERGKR